MSRKPRAIISDNHDGEVSAMVAAQTLEEAAKRLHTTRHALRTYGWAYADGADLALALSHPESTFYRRQLGDGTWTTDRDSLRRRR